jgi:hypothetical protein
MPPPPQAPALRQSFQVGEPEPAVAGPWWCRWRGGCLKLGGCLGHRDRLVLDRALSCSPHRRCRRLRCGLAGSLRAFPIDLGRRFGALARFQAPGTGFRIPSLPIRHVACDIAVKIDTITAGRNDALVCRAAGVGLQRGISLPRRKAGSDEVVADADLERPVRLNWIGDESGREPRS